MNTSRRSFIKTGAMAVAGTLLLNKETEAVQKNKKKGMIGLQLYSIREDMLKDPAGSLKSVAGMGYKYVEHANYVDGKFYGIAPGEFRKMLDDLGLKMISGHTSFRANHWDDSRKEFTDIWKKLVENAAVLGQKYVISPSMDKSQYGTYDSLMKTMEIYNKCGDLCSSLGMKFGYHNHDFEFSTVYDGKKMFDIFMTSIDKSRVVMQLDMGNLYNGGGVAIDVIKQYPGRFENLHVKDEIKAATGNKPYESCIIGEGIVNTRDVLKLATETGGSELYIIEQESYQGKTPKECVKRNLDLMKSWGY